MATTLGFEDETGIEGGAGESYNLGDDFWGLVPFRDYLPYCYAEIIAGQLKDFAEPVVHLHGFRQWTRFGLGRLDIGEF